jgi:hypothetical protein
MAQFSPSILQALHWKRPSSFPFREGTPGFGSCVWGPLELHREGVATREGLGGFAHIATVDEVTAEMVEREHLERQAHSSVTGMQLQMSRPAEDGRPSGRYDQPGLVVCSEGSTPLEGSTFRTGVGDDRCGRSRATTGIGRL